MAIDTGFLWSANSLQAPVHAQIERMNAAVRNTASVMPSRVLGVDPRRLPTKGPQGLQAQRERSALERTILGMGQQAPQVATAGAPASVSAGGVPAITPPKQENPYVVKPPVKVPQPGVDTSIATAVPQAPTDGISKIAPVTGWLSPGANFQIR